MNLSTRLKIVAAKLKGLLAATTTGKVKSICIVECGLCICIYTREGYEEELIEGTFRMLENLCQQITPEVVPGLATAAGFGSEDTDEIKLMILVDMIPKDTIPMLN